MSLCDEVRGRYFKRREFDLFLTVVQKLTKLAYIAILRVVLLSHRLPL